MPDDCPLPTGFMPTVEPFCFEEAAGVLVTYPPDLIGLSSVSSAGEPVTCFGMGPGVQFCGRLSGEPGSTTTVTTCWSDGDCRDWTTVILDCGSGGVTVSSTCGEAGPVAEIHYDPAIAGLSSVSTFGVPLDCTGMAPGVMICGPLPGSGGSPTTVTTCFEGEACTDWPLTIATCDEEDGPHGFWALLDVGCHSETQIYLLFDTPFSDLVPGVPYTYTVTDGDSTYACDPHPTIPGRVYCSGPLPSVPGPLEACFSVNGGPESCTTFDDFVGRIPACGTEVPPDDQPDDTCNAYTNFNDCSQHTNCHWANGLCVSNP